MDRGDDPRLAELVEAVLNSAKYRSVSADLVCEIGAQQIAALGDTKRALKATKNKLHQVGGAYFERQPRYEAWLAPITAAAGDELRVRAACHQALTGHASTRERAGLLDSFYATLFAALPPPDAVFDLACGLNPLARPWMGLPTTCRYYACDIYADMLTFIAAATRALGTPAQTSQCNLLAGPPHHEADVVLLLKTLPVLDQLRRHAGRDLLRALAAPAIFVSFPTRSLGGRAVGMATHYRSYFEALAASEGWQLAERFEFANELVYLVQKR